MEKKIYEGYLLGLKETLQDLRKNTKFNRYKNYRFIGQSQLILNSSNDIEANKIIEQIKEILRDNKCDFDKFVTEIEDEIIRDSNCEVAKKMNFEFQKIFESIIEKGMKNIEHLDARSLNLIYEAEMFYVTELIEEPCVCEHCISYQGHLNLVSCVLNKKLNLVDALMYSLNMRERLQLELLDKESEKLYGFLYATPRRYINFNSIKVYLDQNTINRCVIDKEFHNLIISSKKINNFFYSPSHLEEICKWGHQDKNEFIEKLSFITDDVIVIPWKEDDKKPRLELFFEKPSRGLLRSKINAPKTAEILEEIKYIKYYRNKMLYNRFNKISHIKKINDPSINDNIFEKYKEIVEDVLSALNCSFKLKDVKGQNNIYLDHVLVNDVIYKLSDCLDILNFKKDNQEQKIKSSVHDIEHLIYASRGDVFVTGDKKLYERARQIFGFITPRIKVYCIDEFSELLKRNKVM